MHYEELPLRKQRFVDAYIGAANGVKAEAARMAGYRNPANLGYRLCKEPEVQAAIKERLAECAMGPEEILARLSEQAQVLQAAFLRVDESGKSGYDMEAMREAGLARLVKKITYDRCGNQMVEFYDAQAALELMGRRHGLFVDRKEHSGPGGVPIPVGLSFEEALKHLLDDDAEEEEDGLAHPGGDPGV